MVVLLDDFFRFSISNFFCGVMSIMFFVLDLLLHLMNAELMNETGEVLGQSGFHPVQLEGETCFLLLAELFHPIWGSFCPGHGLTHTGNGQKRVLKWSIFTLDFRALISGRPNAHDREALPVR